MGQSMFHDRGILWFRVWENHIKRRSGGHMHILQALNKISWSLLLSTVVMETTELPSCELTMELWSCTRTWSHMRRWLQPWFLFKVGLPGIRCEWPPWSSSTHYSSMKLVPSNSILCFGLALIDNWCCLFHRDPANVPRFRYILLNRTPKEDKL